MNNHLKTFLLLHCNYNFFRGWGKQGDEGGRLQTDLEERKKDLVCNFSYVEQ